MIPRCERVRQGDLPNAGLASKARKLQPDGAALRYTTWLPASTLALEAPPAEEGEAAAP